MVATFARKRIEILVDAPLLRRVRDIASDAGISGYTLLPTLGGGSDHGRWQEDQVTGGAGSKVMFTTIVDDDSAAQFLSALKPILDEYGLIVTMATVEVMRAERF